MEKQKDAIMASFFYGGLQGGSDLVEGAPLSGRDVPDHEAATGTGART